MVNTVVLVGKFVSLKKNVMTLSIIVSKDDNKSYNLFIPVKLSNVLLMHVKEYIFKDNVVGIKGYLNHENNLLICVAEKITFLSSK